MNHYSPSSSARKLMGLPCLKQSSGQELAIKGYENSKLAVEMKKFPPITHYAMPPKKVMISSLDLQLSRNFHSAERS